MRPEEMILYKYQEDMVDVNWSLLIGAILSVQDWFRSGQDLATPNLSQKAKKITIGSVTIQIELMASEEYVLVCLCDHLVNLNCFGDVARRMLCRIFDKLLMANVTTEKYTEQLDCICSYFSMEGFDEHSQFYHSPDIHSTRLFLSSSNFVRGCEDRIRLSGRTVYGSILYLNESKKIVYRDLDNLETMHLLLAFGSRVEANNDDFVGMLCNGLFAYYTSKELTYCAVLDRPIQSEAVSIQTHLEQLSHDFSLFTKHSQADAESFYSVSKAYGGRRGDLGDLDFNLGATDETTQLIFIEKENGSIYQKLSTKEWIVSFKTQH
jgi:hypothetical protein